MFGFSKQKADKKSQAQAFEEFKTTVSEAIHEAQKHGVWAANLAQHLEAHANVLDASRPWR
jgi:hypothetical protein